jgi:hypothetical protein
MMYMKKDQDQDDSTSDNESEDDSDTDDDEDPTTHRRRSHTMRVSFADQIEQIVQENERDDGQSKRPHMQAIRKSPTLIEMLEQGGVLLFLQHCEAELAVL